MKNKDYLFYIFHLILAFIVSYIVFRIYGKVYVGLDGTYMLNLVKNQHDFMPPSHLISSNILQSQGNIFFPINTYFIPQYLFFHIFNDGMVDKNLAAALFCVELFFATSLFSACLGYRPMVSISSAWLTISIIAYSVPSAIYSIFNLIPHILMLMTYLMLIVSCYILIGKYDGIKNIILLCAAILLLFILIISFPMTTILWGGCLLLFVLVYYYFCKNEKEKTYKKASFILVLLLLFVTGFPFYMLGLFTYTTSWFFPNNLYNVQHGWHGVSILSGVEIYQNYIGPLLWGMSFLAAIITIMKGGGRKKSTAICVVIWQTLCLLLGLKMIFSTKPYFAPLPIYFEMMIWPIYMIFAIVIIDILLKPATSLLKKYIDIKIRLKNKYCIILTFVFPLIIPGSVIATMSNNIPDYGWKWPVKKHELTKMLEEELAITHKNNKFRGRVLNISELENDKELGWYRQHQLDGEVVKIIGNDLRLTGMWYFNIPTLVEYSSTISPPFFAVVSETLNNIEDKQVRGGIAITKVNASILRSMGVKYVISNETLSEPFLFERKYYISPEISVSLYRLTNSNMGDFSPTKVLVSNNASDTLDIIKRDDIDLSKVVITSEPIINKLSPVINSVMSIHEGKLTINATSSDTSLIVLPIEYSNCIKIDDNSDGKGQIEKPIRANLTQTGLVFSGEINVDLYSRTGLLQGSTCKLRDTLEMYNYGLKELGQM